MRHRIVGRKAIGSLLMTVAMVLVTGAFSELGAQSRGRSGSSAVARGSSSGGSGSSDVRSGSRGSAVPRGSVPSAGRSKTRTPSHGRGHSGRYYGRHHGSRIHVGVGYYGGYRYYPYPYYGFYGLYGYYYPYYYPYYPRYPYYRPVAYGGEALGAVDLNVKPKKAQVYLDGDYVGVTGNFDGYPQYLWLETGRHELVFYLPGYQTMAQEVTITAGTVIDLKLRLAEGESRPPEELITVRSERAPAPRAEAARGEAEAPRRTPVTPMLDARSEPGRFVITVQPEDASVYLDGRFLGTGDELSGLHSGLIVDPGMHEIEVVRPGYQSKAAEFSVEAGDEVEVTVTLDPS